MPRQEYSREVKLAAMREIDCGKGMAELGAIPATINMRLFPELCLIGLIASSAGEDSHHPPSMRQTVPKLAW